MNITKAVKYAITTALVSAVASSCSTIGNKIQQKVSTEINGSIETALDQASSVATDGIDKILSTEIDVTVPSETEPVSDNNTKVESTTLNFPVSIAINPDESLQERYMRGTIFLSELQRKEKNSTTPYDRKAFGTPWADIDNNSCKTREDILARDLQNTVTGENCKIMSGTLNDPYTGQQLEFVRDRSGGGIDIDHVVALGNVWMSGGEHLTSEQLQEIANLPENLLAVEASANREKGDKDFAEWQPSNQEFVCEYAYTQVFVKHLYNLTVTNAEGDALNATLQECAS